MTEPMKILLAEMQRTKAFTNSEINKVIRLAFFVGIDLERSRYLGEISMDDYSVARSQFAELLEK